MDRHNRMTLKEYFLIAEKQGRIRYDKESENKDDVLSEKPLEQLPITAIETKMIT